MTFYSSIGKGISAVYFSLSRYAAIFGRAATRPAKLTSLGKLAFALGKRLNEKLVTMSKAPRSATWQGSKHRAGASLAHVSGSAVSSC